MVGRAVAAQSCGRASLCSGGSIAAPSKHSVGVGLGAASFGHPSQVPHMFICPILRDVMDDPVTAADGFTYEKVRWAGTRDRVS